MISCSGTPPVNDLFLEVTSLQPELPPGMSVAACRAVVLHLPARGSEMHVHFQASLTPSEPVVRGSETGECLEAQSWSGERHVVLVGTEDVEALGARTRGSIRGTESSFLYSEGSFAIDFVHVGDAPATIHLLVAWNALTEPLDHSCWFAVDQPHARILNALRANRSIDSDAQRRPLPSVAPVGRRSS